MGTKLEPGKFDCHAKAAPDEPLFTLRGKDPAAPYLVMMWFYSRKGDWSAMHRIVGTMSADDNIMCRISDDSYEKLEEAMRLVGDMEEWYRDKVDKGPDPILTAIGHLVRRMNTGGPGARKTLDALFDEEGIR